MVSPSDFAALNYSMSCDNKIETTQMRSNANPTLTQMRENGEITDDSSASSTASEGGLTSVQSGAIGAMVSLVVVLVLMFVFQLFGFLTVGKKQIAARRQATEENQVSYTSGVHVREGPLTGDSFELKRLSTRSKLRVSYTGFRL